MSHVVHMLVQMGIYLGIIGLLGSAWAVLHLLQSLFEFCESVRPMLGEGEGLLGLLVVSALLCLLLPATPALVFSAIALAAWVKAHD